MSTLTAIILAAGKGTRMKSEIPKVLHPAAGLPLLAYPLEVCRSLKVQKTTVVLGKNAAQIQTGLEPFRTPHFESAIQDPPLGTGHAVQAALKKSKSLSGTVLILSGDVPLITASTIQKLITAHKTQGAVLSFMTAHLKNPAHYGRVVRSLSGKPLAIVEFADATEEQKQIKEINPAIYLVEASFLKEALPQISRSAKGEFYLTELVSLAASTGQKMATGALQNPFEGLGVNTQAELAEAEKILFTRRLAKLMDDGVRVTFPESIAIDSTVKVQAGAHLMGPCFLKGKTSIGTGTVIEPGSWIENTSIGKNCHIKSHSYLTEAKLGDEVAVGPFAHLRPGSVVKSNGKIGNFVELKKSVIGEGSKVSHLSYIGDATVGKKVNIGAGTITCNYDGKNKFKTVLEDGVFVGSDTQFVAPVRVGKGAYIGAGSTITKNVKAGSLALTRAVQKEIPRYKKSRGNS